jgi:hypothetical protein
MLDGSHTKKAGDCERRSGVTEPFFSYRKYKKLLNLVSP